MCKSAHGVVYVVYTIYIPSHGYGMTIPIFVWAQSVWMYGFDSCTVGKMSPYVRPKPYDNPICNHRFDVALLPNLSGPVSFSWYPALDSTRVLVFDCCYWWCTDDSMRCLSSVIWDQNQIKICTPIFQNPVSRRPSWLETTRAEWYGKCTMSRKKVRQTNSLPMLTVMGSMDPLWRTISQSIPKRGPIGERRVIPIF